MHAFPCLFLLGSVVLWQPTQAAFKIAMIYVVPLVLLLVAATGVGVWRLRTLGPKGALISGVRVLIYGGFALFILFCGVLVIHYATGGH